MRTLSLKISCYLAALTHIVKQVSAYSFFTNMTATQRLLQHDQQSAFGSKVVTRGILALVSAPSYSFNEYEDPDGLVYVYRQDNGFWTLIRGITDLEYADGFGMSLAMHTDYFAVVGSPDGDKYGQSSGTVHYFYVEPDPYQTQMEPLLLVQGERQAEAGFGSSVAIGTVNGRVVVAVGAPNHRGRGAVFTYIRNNDGRLGDEEILYTPASSSSSDSAISPIKGFGTCVDVNNNIVAAGAPGGRRGYVYLFQRFSGAFSQTASLAGLSMYSNDNDDKNKNPDQQGDDIVEDDTQNGKQVEEFGDTIKIASQFIFVGSPYAYMQTDQGNNYGKVFVFKYTTDGSGTVADLELRQTLTAEHLPNGGLSSFFSKSLDYCPLQNRLAVGSPYGLPSSAFTGRVSLYTLVADDARFYLEAVLHVEAPTVSSEEDGQSVDDYTAGFGSTVSLSNGNVFVGSPEGDSKFGDVYFFQGKGVSASYSLLQIFEDNFFTTFGLFLLPVGIMFIVLLIYWWRKYKDSNYDDSFSNFITDEVVDFFNGVRGKSASAIESCTSLQYGEDDSSHSTHPMIVGTSVTPPKKKPVKKGKSLKSKTGSDYESANIDDNL